jgi:hypothetical protein
MERLDITNFQVNEDNGFKSDRHSWDQWDDAQKEKAS